jgi:hypothetical protein
VEIGWGYTEGQCHGTVSIFVISNSIQFCPQIFIPMALVLSVYFYIRRKIQYSSNVSQVCISHGRKFEDFNVLLSRNFWVERQWLALVSRQWLALVSRQH